MRVQLVFLALSQILRQTYSWCTVDSGIRSTTKHFQSSRLGMEQSTEQPWQEVEPKAKARFRRNKSRSKNGKSKRDKENSRGSQINSPPSFSEFVPQPEPSQGGFEQSMVLLVGLPGSGKSTLGRVLETCLPWKFSRVNQDELSSRQKCVNRAIEILQDGRCPIVDRCNFDAKQRSHFVQLADKSKIPVDCIVLNIDRQICLNRCRTRQGHPTLPPSKAGMVINGMSKDWKVPSPKEGFRNIFIVENDKNIRDVLSKFIPITHKKEETIPDEGNDPGDQNTSSSSK